MLRRVMAVTALALSLGAMACTAEVEEEGRLPDVDVQGGEAPQIDVDQLSSPATICPDVRI